MKKCILLLVCILCCACRPEKRGPYSKFTDYFNSFSDMIDALDVCQTRFEEKESFIFEIPNNYGCNIVYCISGVCLDGKHNSKTKDDICLNLRDRQPFSIIRDGLIDDTTKDKDSCKIFYLENTSYENSSLYWKFEETRNPSTNKYTLMDKFDTKIVEVVCFGEFSFLSEILNDIKLLIKKI